MQRVRVNVLHRRVAVVDEDLCRPGLERAVDRGVHLIGEQPPAQLVVRPGWADLLPVDDPGGALDVARDEYLHAAGRLGAGGNHPVGQARTLRGQLRRGPGGYHYGKFVFSASEAYQIEDGQVTRPVKGATLIGNGPDVLTRVSMVGNDLALDSGIGTCGKDGQSVPVGVGLPTIRIDGITVGGTRA